MRSAFASACQASGSALPVLASMAAPAASIAAQTAAWQVAFTPPPQYWLLNFPATVSPSSVRMSLSKYWYQPVYCDREWRDSSVASSVRLEPSTGAMKASAIFSHAASMIAAPGSSTARRG